jgi:hypothetical protein
MNTWSATVVLLLCAGCRDGSSDVAAPSGRPATAPPGPATPAATAPARAEAAAASPQPAGDTPVADPAVSDEFNQARYKYASGTGSPEPWPSQLESFCARGAPEACGLAGRLFSDDDPARARRWSLRACELGYGDGCVAASEMETAPADKLRLLERGCQLDALSCLHLAHHFEHDRQPDLTRAATLYEKACRETGTGCDSAADLYERGAGTPGDRAKVKELRRIAADNAD